VLARLDGLNALRDRAKAFRRDADARAGDPDVRVRGGDAPMRSSRLGVIGLGELSDCSRFIPLFPLGIEAVGMTPPYTALE
jgi:hypothetical protein